jgi:hypothetical protein
MSPAPNTVEAITTEKVSEVIGGIKEDRVRRLQESEAALADQRNWKEVPAASKLAIIDSLVTDDPTVQQKVEEAEKARLDYALIERKIDILEKDTIKPEEEKLAELGKLGVEAEMAQSAYRLAQNEAARKKASIKSTLLSSKDPYRDYQRIVQQSLDAYKKRLDQEAAEIKRLVNAAGAGGKDDNKVDPIVLSEMDKALEVRERAKSEKKATVGQRDMERWSKAKNRVIEVVGGPEKIAEIVDQATSSFTGANLLGDKNAIKVQIREIVKSKLNPTSNAFYQEAPRGGLQSVDWEEVIDETVEEVFKGRENARARAAAPVPPTQKSYKAPGTFQSE